MHKLTIKELVLVALFAVILTVQEELLVFLPNVNLTVFLIVLFSKCFGLYKTIMIIIVYVFLDNIVMGSFSPIWTPFMFVGWGLIPVLLNTVFKNVNESIKLAFLGVLFSFLYCWIYLIPNAFVYKIDIKAYLAADIYFEILLAVTSFVTIMWLYEPTHKVLDRLLNKNSNY